MTDIKKQAGQYFIKKRKSRGMQDFNLIYHFPFVL